MSLYEHHLIHGYRDGLQNVAAPKVYVAANNHHTAINLFTLAQVALGDYC